MNTPQKLQRILSFPREKTRETPEMCEATAAYFVICRKKRRTAGK